MFRNRLAAVLFFAASSSSILGQGGGTPPQGVSGPLTLHVVVTPGENGKHMPGLSQGAFTVLDNGAPQPLQSFRAVSGVSDPVKVLIVIDAVNVDFQRVAFAQQEITRVLRANDGRLPQPTALAVFTDTGTQVGPGYSTDGNALSEELNRQTIGLRDLRRSAGFYGAEERLDLSLKALDGIVSRAAGEPGRKFIFWVSPGWPLLSGVNVQYSAKEQARIFGEVVAFSNAMRRSDTTMYVVDPLGAAEGPGRTFYYEQFLKGVQKPSQAVLGDLGAQVLAVQSGGLFLSGNNDISGLLQRCFADASAYYDLTYQPPPAETAGEYHRIQVRVTEPHAVARTRQGYYADSTSPR